MRNAECGIADVRALAGARPRCRQQSLAHSCRPDFTDDFSRDSAILPLRGATRHDGADLALDPGEEEN